MLQSRNQAFQEDLGIMPSFLEKTHFRAIQNFKVDYAPDNITQYVSERTGMQMVVVDQMGPKVNGYFALATEVLDDSGSPHTLEHLCFMGSKNYQYKGVLDKLANRAYSNTNAWTANDHTAYTLDTAGWAGFAQILPVYLEHIIVPTLTDAGCLTEVHHVDGTGNDAGVVYSEMQGVQNTQEMIMDVKANRLMYPEGVGFRYETGGLMENLRILTADRIREFHREMYQPKNLCLVIMGEVDHNDLLDIVDRFESSIIDDIPKPDAPFKRPWIETSQAPPLGKTIVETVEFPEEDESIGEIAVRFLGPNCNDVVSSTWRSPEPTSYLLIVKASGCHRCPLQLPGWFLCVIPRERDRRKGANCQWRLLLERVSAQISTGIHSCWCRNRQIGAGRG